jgi:hypothetical protein
MSDAEFDTQSMLFLSHLRSAILDLLQDGERRIRETDDGSLSASEKNRMNNGVKLIASVQEKMINLFDELRTSASQPTIKGGRRITLEWMQGEDHSALLFPAELWRDLEKVAKARNIDAQYMVTRALIQLLGDIVFDKRTDVAGSA